MMGGRARVGRSGRCLVNAVSCEPRGLVNRGVLWDRWGLAGPEPTEPHQSANAPRLGQEPTGGRDLPEPSRPQFDGGCARRRADRSPRSMPGSLTARRVRAPRWLWVGLAVAVIAAFAVGVGTRSGGSLSSSLAPAWSGTSLTGTQLSSSGERGRWVVLNFFATWCGPCQAETPQLARFAATNSTRSVQVVGVLFDDSASSARAFAQRHGVTWPLLANTDDQISSAYRVSALPQSFVIRPNGTVAAHLYGGVTAAGLESLIGAVKAAKH